MAFGATSFAKAEDAWLSPKIEDMSAEEECRETILSQIADAIMQIPEEFVSEPMDGITDSNIEDLSDAVYEISRLLKELEELK